MIFHLGMAMGKASASILIKAPVNKVFRFISNGENAPQWHPSIISTVRIAGGLGVGSTVNYVAKIAGIKFKWVTEAVEWIENVKFKDVLIEGPFKKYVAIGEFQQLPEGTRFNLIIEYELKIPLIGELLDKLLVQRRVQKHTMEGLEKAKKILEEAKG